MKFITDNLKIKLVSLTFALLLFPLMSCQQKGLADYSTPETVLKTYLTQAQTLRIVADHRNYRRAINCFLKKDRKWYVKNYDKLEFEREKGVYGNLYKTKKMAYAFGRAIVPAGPNPDTESIGETVLDGSKASISIGDYPEPVRFIKVKDRWYISGIFGKSGSDPK